MYYMYLQPHLASGEGSSVRIESGPAPASPTVEELAAAAAAWQEAQP